MSQDFEQRVRAVDAVTLTPIVRQALSQPAAEVLDWTSAPLAGGAANSEEGVIGRVLFTGHAQTEQRVESWAIALKAFAPPRKIPPLAPSNLSYWKREVLAFQSGLLDELPDSIATARCFAIVEYPSEETWVWMEYIHDVYKRWSLEQYKLAARDLGRFNGAYLTGRDLPTIRG